MFLSNCLPCKKEKSNVFTESKIANVAGFFLCTRSCTQCPIYVASFNFNIGLRSCTNIIYYLTATIRKLRLREAK